MDVTDVAARLLERAIERGQAVLRCDHTTPVDALRSSVRAAAAAQNVHVRTGMVGDVLAVALADAALWDAPVAEMRKLLEAPAAANEVA